MQDDVMNFSTVRELNEQVERQSAFLHDLRSEIGKVMVGQDTLVSRVLIALLADGHILLELVSHLPLSLINFVNNRYRNPKSSLSMCPFHQGFDQFNTLEKYPLTGTSHMWEQTMLNRVILGGIGWIMGNTDFNANLLNQ